MSVALPNLDLRPDHWAIVRDALSRHVPDREVLAFGSRATWTAKDYSDLDLAIMGEEPLSLRASSALDEALVESDLPFRVDIVDWGRIDDSFRAIIRRDAVAVQASKGVSNAAGIGGASGENLGWAQKPLGQVVELKRGYDLPGRKRSPGPVPVVSSSGITGSHRESKVRGPGVVTGRYGTLGKVYYILDDFWPLNTTLYVRDFKGNDPRFVSYLLRGLDFSGHSDKAAVPGLNRNHLHEESARLPTDVGEQRAIAHVLGSLDDKIELNRRMNETLEAMARALFKSWFVDFDPVRAKMEGRDTGLPQDIAELFPDRMVDSELGQIPEGWEVSSLVEVAALRREGTDPAGEASDTPYIGLADMPRGSIALTDWGKIGTVSSRKSAFKTGDILFGKLRPYFHKVGIAPVDGFCSTDIVVLSARKPQWSSFVLTCVSSSAFVAHTSQTATGTKMPRTSWQAMSGYELCRPTDAIASGFQRSVSPMLGRIVGNVHESRTLAALRDALLPKLISGEVRVPATDRRPAQVTNAPETCPRGEIVSPGKPRTARSG